VTGSEVLRAELAEEQLTSLRGTVAHYECMGDAMLRQLPSTRTRVRMDVADGMWMQRLTEMATPRHDIVADAADADYVVTLGAEVGACGAPQVVVMSSR
jgi:hypothetical protein